MWYDITFIIDAIVPEVITAKSGVLLHDVTYFRNEVDVRGVLAELVVSNVEFFQFGVAFKGSEELEHPWVLEEVALQFEFFKGSVNEAYYLL